MNHTPGPWECPNLDDDYSSRQGWITTKEGTLIAAMEPSDNQESDARLIAAAPELLAACQEVMRNFVAAKAEYDFKGEALGVTASRAAIAKAIGAAS